MDWPGVAIIIALIGLQTFWVSRSLDKLGARVDELKADMTKAFDAIGARLDRIDATLREHGEHIARESRS